MHRLRHLLRMVAASVLVLSTGSALAGPIFITGHDPDFHAQGEAGAQRLLRSAVNYVRHGSPLPMLWVESRRSAASGHRVGKNGLLAIGLKEGVDFIHMNAAELSRLTPEQWASLHTVYSALAVASDFGGMLTQAELDQLNAHKQEIAAFFNAGGGILALSESGDGARLTTRNWFGFLPIEVKSTGNASPPYTVTAFGREHFGLVDGDVNSPSHSHFDSDFGLNVVSRSAPTGQIMTLAGEARITEGGFLVANAGPDQTVSTGSVVLDGSGSSADAQGAPLTYTWTGSGQVLASSTSPRVAVTLSSGVHTLTLTVTNSRGETATDQVVITVTGVDSDGDGLTDEREAELGLDPHDPDCDDDGLSDGIEVAGCTDPLDADSDNDGFTDGIEVAAGTDPCDPNSCPLRPPSLQLGGGSLLCIPDGPGPEVSTCTVVIIGDAGSNCGIHIYDGGTQIAHFETSGPIRHALQLPIGSRTLTVLAHNAAGTDTETVQVVGTPNPMQLLSGPTDGTVVGGPDGDVLTWEFQTMPNAQVEVSLDLGNGPTLIGTFTADASGRVIVRVNRKKCGCKPVFIFCPKASAGAPCGSQTVIRVIEDDTPPVVSCQELVSGPWTPGATPLTVTASDPGSAVEPNPLAYDWEILGADGSVTRFSGGPTHSQVFGVGDHLATVTVTDAAGNASSCSTRIHVEKHVTECSLPDVTVPFGELLSVEGSVADLSAALSLSGLPLEYTLDGQPVSSLQGYLVLLTPGTHTLGVRYAGDARYQGCAASSTLTVPSTPGKITGGGTMTTGAQNFGFNAQTRQGGSPFSFHGSLQFDDRARNIRLHSGTITALAINASRTRGVFAGTASVNGTPGFTFVVDVLDEGEPRRTDRFRIRIEGNGLHYDSGPLTSGGLLERGGNVQIHK